MENFWTSEIEEALVKYVKCEDVVEKNKIFDDYLFIPLRKLIDVILERYRLPNVDDDVKFDILSDLVLQVSKFNPDAKLSSGKKVSGKTYCIILIRCWIADYKLKTARQRKVVQFEESHETFLNKIR